MTHKQLVARLNALSDENASLRTILSTLRAGQRAQRAQRLSNARAQAKVQAKLYKGERLCLD